MSINLKRPAHVIFFVGFLGILSITIGYLFKISFPNIPFWMEDLSPLFVYGLLYSAFDIYLWKFGIFRHLRISIFPNLNGRWEGEQISSYKDSDGNNVRIDAKLEVRQTFSRMKIFAYYDTSESESVIANFADFDGDIYLYYTYDNNPNSLKVGTMAMHRGTAKLKYLEKEGKIKGTYFNSLQNQGDFILEFKQSELIEHF